MTTLLLTIVFAVAAFGLMFVALLLGRFFGRDRKRRCACAEARAIMKRFETRDAEARHAAKYRAESVNVQSLPIVGRQGGDES